MQLWTGNEFTTCTNLHADRDEPEEEYQDDSISARDMLGRVIVYCLCAIAGIVGGWVWWLAHR